MSMGDKTKHAADEAAGKVTGNEDLEAKGHAQQAEADVKQVGDKAKDAAKDVLGN